MTTILLLIFVLYTVAHAWEHANDSSVDHNRATLSRTTVGALVVVADFLLNHDLILSLFLSWVILSLFWIVFDISRNAFVGEHWLYIGKTSSIDKWGWKNQLMYYFMKFFCLVGSIGSYIQYGL